MSITDEQLSDLSNLIEGAQQAVGSEPERAPTVAPANPSVSLPVGLWDPLNGLRDTAEVRELTGFDEEIIARAKTSGAAMNAVLERAVVSIGGKDLEKEDLDMLTIGDRLALLVGIRRVTWGESMEVPWFCESCDQGVEIDVDLESLPSRNLDDKERDRVFTVDLPSGGAAKMGYPTGKLHVRVLNEEITSGAGMTTALIADCVNELPGHLVVTEKAAKSLSSRDRKAIADAVVNALPGPLLEEIPAKCPDCNSDLEVAIPVGALFPG